jgi:hypothetical protein
VCTISFEATGLRQFAWCVAHLIGDDDIQPNYRRLAAAPAGLANGGGREVNAKGDRMLEQPRGLFDARFSPPHPGNLQAIAFV